MKEKTEAFKKRLFYTLFDIETPVEKNLEILESLNLDAEAVINCDPATNLKF